MYLHVAVQGTERFGYFLRDQTEDGFYLLFP